MKKKELKKNESPGSFALAQGMPDEYYAFTDGRMSCTVERNGGINTLTCLDVLEKDGKLYPDRGYTPIIFRKEGSLIQEGGFGQGRPAYGPAVQFISTSTPDDGTPGRNLFHVPDCLQLYPFGFTSESLRFGRRTTYDLAIVGLDVLFAFTNRFPTRENFVVSINKGHIFQGESVTIKNQIVDIYPGLDRTQPFEEKRSFCQRWDFIGFDPACNGFVLEGAMEFSYGTSPAGSGRRKVSVLLAADCPLTFSENKCRYFLTTPWSDRRKIRLCLTMAGTRQEAAVHVRKVFNGFEKIFSARIRESVSYSKKSIGLDAAEYPEVRCFSKTAPSFLKAMVLAETPREACIRAATHKYGYFIGWDQIWPAKAFLLMGDWETARKLVAYCLDIPPAPALERNDMFTHMIIMTAEDFLAVSGDAAFLKENYHHFVRFFNASLTRVSANGLIPTVITFGADDPKEIGVLGEVWAADCNGWWYGACRSMANLALLTGDKETSQKASDMAARIEASYLETFFDPKTGYLFTGVDVTTRKGIPVYQNVATLGMDYPYGEYLLRRRIKEIGKFQAYQLCHPAGRSALAFWDIGHEMYKNALMYQHLAHEMRVARAAGLGAEVARMMAVYLGHFRRNKVAIETHNLTGCEGDITHRSNWQAFGTRALYSGIVEGLMGIQCDLGGFGYVPCEGAGEMAISDFKFRNGRWDIRISGAGPFVARFAVDGKPLRGAMKVPSEFLADGRSHTLAVMRGRTPFKEVTLLAAPGASICNVTADGKSLAFGVVSPVHASVKFFAPQKPAVEIGGEPAAAEWDSKTRIGWFNAFLEPGRRVRITRE